MPVPVGSVRPCSSTPGGRVAGPLPPPTNACRTVLRPASVPSQALQRLHLPSRKVPAAERQRVRAAEAGTPQIAMAGVTPGSCGRLCPDSVPRTLPTGAPVYCSASRVTPTPCSVGGSLSTSQGSVGAGEIGPPARGPMRLPMCRAARSARAGHHGAWGADTLGLLMSPGLPVKVLAVGAFRIFIFCCPGSGSKYGPSDSETLHMEERR